ncbi:MAG: DUF4012 domain-containing protein [Candidatus Yanofskybacteria bacterium]|nr:DUF4012 domain-containing protein [Candidatus Yanofskybacteria bacterium]
MTRRLTDVVSDDIVRELERAVLTADHTVDHAAMRMDPVDAFARLQRRPLPQRAPRGGEWWRALLGLAPWFLGAGAVIAGLLYVSQYGMKVKGRVVQQGSAAIGYLVSAKDSMERFDIERAHEDLQRARDAFDGAGRELDVLGPAFTGFLSRVPGFSSVRIGQDLLHAGRLLSDAGVALSDALNGVTNTGGLLDERGTGRTTFGEVFLPLQEGLKRAQDDIEQAQHLIDGIDAAQVPDEQREQFISLKERLPALRALVDRGVAATVFLSDFTGTAQPQRYLVLFSNSSELRPTGGFPGSYGILTFENGKVKSFRADDVYNPDGQIKDLIVPPLQLQHITPSWGMRDAGWWADWPTSARKTMSYWERGGGAAVDGVLSIKPDVLAGILKITGPISMPAYDLVLNSENVLSTLQLEVESKKTAQPKQVIVDLAPLILDRLARAPAAQWGRLLVLFKEALDARDIMMYFENDNLERFVTDEGWDGAVKEASGDYLMINVSNVKGAKSDAVTDTSAKLESWLEDGAMVHRLTINRRHNGGSSAYGFYNKPNHSWVRILVPKGSVLRGITGNEQPSYRPLVNYATERTAIRDDDLTKLEASYRAGIGGATIFDESGKTGFGFWMSVDPGEIGAVQLEYVVPAKYIASDYRLLVQRQPGLDVTDLEVTIQNSNGVSVTTSEPPMTTWPDSWRLHTKLERDLELSAKIDR